eukprot:gene24671-biopygen16439
MLQCRFGKTGIRSFQRSVGEEVRDHARPALKHRSASAGGTTLPGIAGALWGLAAPARLQRFLRRGSWASSSRRRAGSCRTAGGGGRGLFSARADTAGTLWEKRQRARRGPDAGRTIDIKEADAGRTRAVPFLPGTAPGRPRWPGIPVFEPGEKGGWEKEGV